MSDTTAGDVLDNENARRCSTCGHRYGEHTDGVRGPCNEIGDCDCKHFTVTTAGDEREALAEALYATAGYAAFQWEGLDPKIQDRWRERADAILAAGWRRDGGQPEIQYGVGDYWATDNRLEADEQSLAMDQPIRTRQVVPLGPWVLVDNQPVCSCGGRRWVADKGWQSDRWDTPRSEGAGLIPCGFCNHGGWNTPLVEPVRAAGHETGDQA